MGGLRVNLWLIPFSLDNFPQVQPACVYTFVRELQEIEYKAIICSLKFSNIGEADYSFILHCILYAYKYICNGIYENNYNWII